MDENSEAVAGPVERPVRPLAWMRRWYFNGEEPRKEKNASGRLAWPLRFKWLPVTPHKIMADDVPLYGDDPAA